MNRVFLLAISILSVFSLYATEENPQTFMRASYQYTAMDTKRNGDETVVEDEFILQIAVGESHFFSRKTYEYEQLMATKEGKDLKRSLMKEATTKTAEGIFIDMKKVSDRMPKRGQRTRVYKYHDKGEMEVFNYLPGEDVVYTVPMSELEWTLADSIKTILGYQCQLAVADYHGRKWNAWFATDVPVQEGPWQFCGLAGLIFKAESEGGEFKFEITGLEQVSEPIVEFKIEEDKLFRYKRKNYLQELRKHKEDPGKVARELGGKASWADGHPVERITLHHDLIETDYRE